MGIQLCLSNAIICFIMGNGVNAQDGKNWQDFAPSPVSLPCSVHPHCFLLWSQANKLKFIPIICAVRKENLNYYNAISSSCICFVCSLLLINLLFFIFTSVDDWGECCYAWIGTVRSENEEMAELAKWKGGVSMTFSLMRYTNTSFFFFCCCIPASLFNLVSSAGASTLMWFFFKRKLWFFCSGNAENHVQLPRGVSSMR